MIKKVLSVWVLIFCSMALAVNAYAEDDILKVIEKQRIELARKEESLKKEEARLSALKSEVDGNIDKYTKLLEQIDNALNGVKESNGKNLKHVAKAYEAMEPEDAAARLEELDKTTSVKILLMMSSKKAGAIMGVMKPAKATQITKELAKAEK